ncbi:2-ketoisovalerate ferredoxin oxidoreductase [Thermosipho melanesiensis]|uniref:Pyruvate flavodoxin/ferredoxin oxidoreductase domain protein n=2 Tax=Thermosipho melanesiensis TaxID=46541 RepID=A6LJ80_THEM4|nr:3-methyl-2-oxobutanoate dehydrogenase subunit VorB [Thermosipho melanesiensis]ABR29981.1 pyruvate flavodoxin/ferredoxin oxidoreductase domain protein [Thermosipho melanesiensis BI429]APT73185.1 2-ketoisovalerate ferredoxin oxidoreductase [Thermosipho melanesiensis]OOC38580.1 2-ketoisovalerate ferredoxin oxidoreductase [Thermosipho melanesiensis]OOC40384.1 2-ketoisovalerate ferredoxin oxidoreductase [Thermosipho melanesiensis]OOC40648.1 2-ketoisovalerate ferredoxin oxidoreductase [Thermosiph
MEKVMVKGTEAIGEAAIRAGCRHFFGYPITPQSELPEYMAKRLPEVGGVFLQTESEVATVNMLYGAACTGKRVMTSTSSPGFSLMMEGVSYMACAKLPAVFVNVVRGGPGLGDIQPAQGDYWQATKGGGHGDYRLIVLAPSTVQEAVDLTVLAFDLSDKYRTPALILADGLLGQMMEPVVFPEFRDLSTLPDHSDWALTGAKGREPHIVTSFDIDPYNLEKMNLELVEIYRKIEENEVRWEEYRTDDAEIVITAFGTIGRIAKSVVDIAREEGLKVGLFRPITVWPFPYEQLEKLVDRVDMFFDVEMNMGQMLEDVKLAVKGKKPVKFYSRMGGVVPTPTEILNALKEEIRR